MRGGGASARAGAAAGLALALVLGGGVLLDPGSGSEPASGGDTAPPPARGSLEALQARLDRVPGDWTAWSELGSARLQQARVTGDPSHYPLAEDAFRESLRVRPDGNETALAGMGALAAARHDFAGAESWARQAVAVDPYDAPAHGVLFDGLVELGRYDEAEQTLQRMADLSPTAPAFARISYLRELYGDIEGARQAMERALATASSTDDAVFALHQLGDLAFSTGDLDAAEARYAEGLRRDPTYLPLLAGTARVAAARGETESAITTYRRVLDAQPLPAYAVELGDLLAAAGRPEEAEEQYALVEAATTLVEANGGTADLEAALFAADHGEPEAALAAARAEHARRQNVFADDALAWALHRNGRHADALPLAERALRLGTRSALLHFHLGMIQSALGDVDGARENVTTALQINPHFSTLHAPAARAELDRLGAA